MGWNSTWVFSGLKAGGSPYPDIEYGVALDASGDIYETGATPSFGAFGIDDLLLRFSPSGGFVWQRTWRGVGDENGNSVATDSLDNIYVTGSTNSTGAGGHMRYSADDLQVL